MIFEFDLDIPANTAEKDKIKINMKLTYGILHQIDIMFPTGCAGLVYCHINDQLKQIFPTNEQGKFKGDGVVISGKVYYELYWEPFELQFWGWNEDDTYDHRVTCRLWILRPWQLDQFSEERWRYRTRIY